MIIGIVCVDKNWGIGKKNDLLFHLKKDMEFFKNTTMDSIVFCGYRQWGHRPCQAVFYHCRAFEYSLCTVLPGGRQCIFGAYSDISGRYRFDLGVCLRLCQMAHAGHTGICLLGIPAKLRAK